MVENQIINNSPVCQQLESNLTETGIPCPAGSTLCLILVGFPSVFMLRLLGCTQVLISAQFGTFYLTKLYPSSSFFFVFWVPRCVFH